MSVAISWAKKVELAKCDILASFPKSSHIAMYFMINFEFKRKYIASDHHEG